MGKKLITAVNYLDYICDNKLFITSDVIVTPGAKDKIRKDGVEIIYNKDSSCENKETPSNKEIEKKIIEMLVKDFGITAPEVIEKILQKVKDLI